MKAISTTMFVQRPLPSGFNASSTALDVVAGVDLTGRTAVVTGGHSGLGLETVRALSAAGASVVVPVRDPAKGRERLAGIDGIEITALDLADPDSIDGFAAHFLQEHHALDILVNSAGIMGVPLTRDPRGYEQHFATNHLGHFQLVRSLWPALAAAQGISRVVNVSAWAHRTSPIDFDDMMFEHRPYEWWLGYGQSKTANILHAVAITDRGASDGIEGFAVHPGGIVETNLSSWLTPELKVEMGLVHADGRPVIDPENGKKTVEQGASTQTWMATDARLEGRGGVFGENTEISEVVQPPQPDELARMIAAGVTPAGVVPHAIDRDIADRLWVVSETLIGSGS